MTPGIAGSNGFNSVFVTAPDGLKLHVRDYGPRLAPSLPVVCLPGLARSAADFHDLALALAGDAQAPRRVLALDYRGRGLSDHDRDPRNYNLATELADLQAVLTALAVPRAAFVGTSRGGILTMMLGCARPTAIAAVVLNDIGPVIEPGGLVRIKSYVGKLPRPKTFEEGGEILRRLFGHQFTNLTEDQWLAYSHRTFKADQRSLAPIYDVRLAATLEGIDFNRPLPPLWNEFDSLARVPMMVVRGANSDLLSEETLAAMRGRRATMETINVPDQGHAPLLMAPDEISRIAAFVAACEPKLGSEWASPLPPERKLSAD
jgi:pimeloyl-ACP methyl ester carboxylesterase